MPKSLTQYRVFIGSPGGLNEERRRFRGTLERYTANHSEPRGVTFYAVGWEDTLGGAGRPQKLINEDLSQCDYAVFVLHDRWGSPPGSQNTSGTEEEWQLAEKLYAEAKIRNIALFFKQVDRRQLSDPGEQLKKVLEFKNRIEEDKKYLFKSYSKMNDFCEELEKHLAKWLRDHEGAPKDSSVSGPASASPSVPKVDVTSLVAGSPAVPGYDYWMAEAERLLKVEPSESRNYAGVLFCSERALAAAHSDIERARAKNALGVAQFFLNNLTEAIASFTAIVEVFASSDATDGRIWLAKALFNKAATLGQLGRTEDEIAYYDDVITRFGAASELPLREQVARSLVNKGIRCGQLGRSEEEIAIYDDAIARFSTASELSLREQTAIALFNKGLTLGKFGRSQEEIATYDDVIARFGSASELPLRECVAQASFNKGVRLGKLGRNKDAISAYDDVIARFETAPELPLRQCVAQALFNKGFTVAGSEDAIAVYDDLIARFGTAPELPLREQVAKALFNKGGRLGQLGRTEDKVAIYDNLIAHFGSADEAVLKDLVGRARALRKK